MQRGHHVGVEQKQEGGEERAQHQALGHGLPELLLQRHCRHLSGHREGQVAESWPQGVPATVLEQAGLSDSLSSSFTTL